MEKEYKVKSLSLLSLLNDLVEHTFTFFDKLDLIMVSYCNNNSMRSALLNFFNSFTDTSIFR